MLLSDLYLWLSVSHISTQKLNRILEVYPPEKLWEQLGQDKKYDIDEKTVAMLKRSHSEEFIEREKHYLKLNNIEYVTRADPAYPKSLLQREVVPPPVLYYKGDINLCREPCIAVVGTRRCTPYGKYAVNKIVGELAESGMTIVSGLATGIDGFAHAAALDVGGKTIAVLGSGLFNVTPVSNIGLFDAICKKGLVISEYTPDTHANEYTFPQRNRIISGLSRGVLVVEAAEKSGSLITANCAAEQGRDVFAVPGDIDKLRSIGTNKLIKQGATPVTNAKDILDCYKIASVTKKRNAPILDMFETRILDLLKSGEKTFDALMDGSGLTPPELISALSSLTIEGLIREISKNVYSAVV